MDFMKKNWITILILVIFALSYLFIDWKELSIFNLIKR